MKTLLICLVVSIPNLLYAQSNTAIQYRHVVPLSEVNKEKLFERAKKWFDEKFISSKILLQSANKEEGELKGKGEMTFTILASGKPIDSKVTYDIHIKVANTAYVFQVSNFVHQYINQESTGFGLLTTSDTNPINSNNYNQETMNNLWAQAKLQAGLRIEPLMDKLKVQMKTKDK